MTTAGYAETRLQRADRSSREVTFLGCKRTGMAALPRDHQPALPRGEWAIGIYKATTEQYSENEFPWSYGPLTGTPEQGIDETLLLYAGPPGSNHAVPPTAKQRKSMSKELGEI
jgi:hypothetical protein